MSRANKIIDDAKDAPRAKAAERDAAREAKFQDRIIAEQQDRIDRLTKARFKLPASRRTRGKAGSYCRLIVPDTHGAHVDPEAIAAFFGDLEVLAPSVHEIVMLGDHLDCGGFLAQHHTLGYVAETTQTFEDDVDAANGLLDIIQGHCPGAAVHYLEGNHERRIERWCVDQSVGNGRNAEYLLRLFGVESQLHLTKRRVHHYKQGVKYQDCRVASTIRLGKCFFSHGERTGKYAAKSTLTDFNGNIVFGHIHAIAHATAANVKDGGVAAWCPGCLSLLQPYWMHSRISQWSHGYGLQFVTPDGDFLHINVPILDGKSYLTPLIERVK